MLSVIGRYIKLNIEKIKAGMIIKNYKELCSLLNINVTTGKARILQLMEFERYVKYHKIGNKFVIDEVFELEKEKIDKRKAKDKVSNNNMYSKDIQALIIDLLAQSKDNQLYLSVNALMRKLEMVNDNYATGRRHVPKLSEITEVPQEYCYDFYNNINIKLRDKLETALKGLRNRALVIWNHSITVCIREAQPELNELGKIKVDKNNRVVMKVIQTHREASKIEKELILETEKKVLIKNDCTSLQQAYLSGKWKIFKDEVNSILLEKANIEYYYTSYNVVYNHPHILEAQEQEKKSKENIKKMKVSERKETKANLNKNICNFTNKTAKSIQNRTRKKELIFASEKIYIKDEYLTYTKKLCDTVISSEAEDIRHKLVKDVNQKQLSFDINSEDEYLPF